MLTELMSLVLHLGAAKSLLTVCGMMLRSYVCLVQHPPPAPVIPAAPAAAAPLATAAAPAMAAAPAPTVAPAYAAHPAPAAAPAAVAPPGAAARAIAFAAHPAFAFAAAQRMQVAPARAPAPAKAPAPAPPSSPGRSASPRSATSQAYLSQPLPPCRTHPTLQPSLAETPKEWEGDSSTPAREFPVHSVCFQSLVRHSVWCCGQCQSCEERGSGTLPQS